MSSPPPKHSLSSPTSGNTPQQVLPTPSSSTSVSLRHQPPSKPASLLLRKEIEQQLLEKQKLLQESNNGIGRNVLLRQIEQFEKRLKELDANPNGEPQPASSVDRLRSLERDLSSYRSHPFSHGISSIRNKEKLLNQRSPNNAINPVTTGLDPLPSPSTSTSLPPVHGHDSTSLLPLPPPPTGSTPTKRRSKIPNTDRRNTDIEFATEIGQGLLLEVRKMHAQLQEKEEKLRTLENQKADLERAAEAMAKQMRQREENEEKLKEETWNLELAKQELVISVTDLQSNLSKANAEQNKLAKQVSELRSEIEQLRDREEKLTNTIDAMKQRHEQDMSSIRRHAAAIQREKTDQTKQIETLASELAIAKAQSRMSKHALSSENESTNRRTGQTGELTDSDHAQSSLTLKNDSSSTSTSPPASPKQSPAARNQAMEVETLKTSLAHAHRMVSNLRSNLHKEKTEKFEFKKLLAESQETIEQLQNDPRMWVDAGPSRSGSTPSSGAIVRGEDGQIIGRRPHKASTSSSLKRRGGKKGSRQASRISNRTSAANDRNSVYSYSSMSDNEESEMDSFDESDGEKMASKPSGFVPLSSELSQVAQKPVLVDAEMNTDPIDFLLPTPNNESTMHRSLGDELNQAMSRSPSQETDSNTGGLLAGADAGLRINALVNKKEPGVEISTQTELESKLIGTEIATQTQDAPIVETMEIFTQTDPEPEKPQTIQVEVEVQTDSPAVGCEMLVQTDGAELAEMATQTIDPQLEILDKVAIVHYAPTMVELETQKQNPTHVEPEDPAIALAAVSATTAAAIAASRLAALEAAIDCSTQSEPIVMETHEQATQSESLMVTDCGVQSEPMGTVDTGIQSEPVVSRDADAQYDIITETKDASVQHEQDDAATLAALAVGVNADIPTETNQPHISTGTQSDHVEAIDGSTQYETVPGLDHETQYSFMGIDHSTQSVLAETMECGVQSEAPITVDMDVQASVAAVETKDVDVQATIAAAETKDVGVQCETLHANPMVPIIINDSDEEFFDAHSKPSSRSTVKNAAVFGNMKPASERSVADANKDEPTRNDRSMATAAAIAIGAGIAGAMGAVGVAGAMGAMGAAGAAGAAGITGSASIASVASIAGAVGAAGATSAAAAAGTGDITASTEAGAAANIGRTDDDVNVTGASTGVVADSAASSLQAAKEIPPESSQNGQSGNVNRSIAPSNTTRNIVHSLGDNELVTAHNDSLGDCDVPSEKLFTKSETDALIASAVALALANAAASNKNMVQQQFLDDPKRHTCDMSLNGTNKTRDADSAVVSHSSVTMDDDDEEFMTEADFGNVVVHVPTEEDTITSSPYQEKRQRERELVNQQSEQQFKKPRVLADGPTTAFDQAPVDLVMVHDDYLDQNREITEADVPVRPANPPPLALLNKAGRSPAFTDNRSMSPISARSKGKQPYDPYSDLESQPSHENMLHQQLPHLDKRRSVSLSSLSTNNTNEQLHSITSSQYDTSGVPTNSVTATDPNTINLITQTMIGDWLWKYTRKAVGGGMSERRHQRYFWIHPYTRTLYWSSSAPGLDGSEIKAKSAMIENITAIPDLSANADGLPNVSLLIQTSHRQLKLTAPSMEKHDLWFESISYLLARNGSSSIGLLTDKKADHAANSRSLSSGTTGSLLKRPSFRRIHDIFQQPTASTTSMTTSGDDLEDFDDEALEDVRMCCNGKHHVSKLEKDHSHRHHYRNRKNQNRGAVATIG